MRLRHLRSLLVLPLAFWLGGCDLLGLEDAAKLAAAKEAEGKAVGGACRHSGRALEDCYLMNPKAQKAAIYAGWRDMDAYMRDNNIQAVRPDLTEPPGGNPPAAVAGEAAPAEAPADKKKTAEDKKAVGKHSSATAGPLPAQRRIVG